VSVDVDGVQTAKTASWFTDKQKICAKDKSHKSADGGGFGVSRRNFIVVAAIVLQVAGYTLHDELPDFGEDYLGRLFHGQLHLRQEGGSAINHWHNK